MNKRVNWLSFASGYIIGVGLVLLGSVTYIVVNAAQKRSATEPQKKD